MSSLCLRLAVLLPLGALAGCDNMQHQQNVRTFTPSAESPQGVSARTPPAHTVDRAGSAAVVDAAVPPLSRPLLERGQVMFDAICATCHGPDGYGGGIVVRRGFPAPASLHDTTRRGLTDQQIYAAITEGRGSMYPMGDRLSPRDRWAVVYYIRALQLSQRMSVTSLTSAEQAALAAQ